MNTLLARLRRVSPPLLVILLGALTAAWFVGSRPQAVTKTPEEKVWPVQVVRVTAMDVQPTLSVFGEVEAAREAELRAMVAGRLVELDPAFRNGNRIEAGAALAVIDPVDYENQLAEQRAELARAEAQLGELQRELEWEIELEANAVRQVELAERALARTEQLAATGRESKKVRDDTEVTLAVSQQSRLQRAQTISRLRARIRDQQAAYEKIQAILARAERDLAHTHVVAPFTGHVTDVRLALGQRVAVGETLGRLLSASELEVRFDIPEADFARLIGDADKRGGSDALIGRALDVVWRLGADERVFSAQLARIGAEIDPALGGIELYATLAPDASARGLRAGAFVEIRIPDVVYRDVYRVPAKALATDGEIYTVVDERLVAVAVEVVRKTGDDVLVRGALDPAHPVVARIFAGIGPGLRAQVL